MSKNQILVTLQIESNEVRMIAGQFYNDRLNILSRKYLPTKGMDGITITDKNKVAETVKKVKDEIGETLGTPVEKVLLVIPTYRFHRETRKINKMVDQGDKVGVEDIRGIYREGFASSVIADDEIISIGVDNYRVNGLIYHSMPIGETGDYIEADVSLLCSDKMTTYDYIQVTSMAGLKVIDICLDSFAAAKEMALFEQTLRSYALNIQIEREHTVYSLIYNGQLVRSISELEGYDAIVRKVASRYHMPYDKALTLVFKYTKLEDHNYRDRIITRWTEENGQTISVTYDDMQKTINPMVQSFLGRISGVCREIVKLDNLTVYLSGGGAALDGLEQALTRHLEKEVRNYCPETLGLREHRWTAPLGLFYACKDNEIIYREVANSVNLAAYIAALEERVSYDPKESSDITQKVKSFTGKIFNIRNSEGE